MELFELQLELLGEDEPFDDEDDLDEAVFDEEE